MKTKIGVIAPHDSLQRIMYVAKEFEDISFVPYPYEQLEEVSSILKKHRQDVDQWFFSGVLNYTYAMKNNLITADEGAFPPLHGASFFGILLEAQLNSNQVFRQVGIDTITNEEFDKILSYYQLEDLTYYTHPFESNKSADELVQFHSRLYEEGKIEVVITSIKDVYLQLKEKKIPVYRVTPSYLSIKMIIQFLEERAQSNLYRNSQVAVIGCRIEMEPDNLEELYYSFKTKYQELDVRRQLFEIAEKTNGSVMQMGDGLFFIFTTRGELSIETEGDLFSLIDEIHLQTSLQVKISIGFGETVLQAEQHVRLGFRHIKDYDKPILLVVDDDQSISAKHQEEQINYSTVEIGASWKEKMKDVNLSPGVVSKITAYANHYRREQFSSQDLARWLKSTERNGRRILAEMERVGIVEQSGEAQSGERGRPRKLFQFTGN
ncbi:hypothetical protein [Halobacillus sp. Marseille-P3879]|uniref:hypothetical protein n=1 Tax=Halobacillus sp. Marseille-P3879 TaxID=2045014 RepID=UPI000C7B7E00|nr:hypothetical protein [Halobacillus sp. Marseille-P3879]